MEIAHAAIQNAPAQAGAMTIEFWLRATGVSGAQGRPVAKRGCSTAGYTIQYRSAGVVQAELGGLCDHPIAFPSGTWSHYAVTWSREQNIVRMFVNGAQTGSVVPSSANLEQLATSLRFGEYCGQTTYGGMDNIRIWSTARTAAEIARDMSTQFDESMAAAQSNLVGSWTFDGAEPLADGTGLNPIGVLEGGAVIGIEDFYPNPCPGDLDASNTVTGVDLAIVLTNWGVPNPKYPQSDINCDGSVDAADLAIVLSSWGACP
jgi:hypothetical protein